MSRRAFSAHCSCSLSRGTAATDPISACACRIEKLTGRKRKETGKKKELARRCKKLEGELKAADGEVVKGEDGARQYCGVDEEIASQ